MGYDAASLKRDAPMDGAERAASNDDRTARGHCSGRFRGNSGDGGGCARGCACSISAVGFRAYAGPGRPGALGARAKGIGLCSGDGEGTGQARFRVLNFRRGRWAELLTAVDATFEAAVLQLRTVSCFPIPNRPCAEAFPAVPAAARAGRLCLQPVVAPRRNRAFFGTLLNGCPQAHGPT